jgi:hypothetical protein
MPIAHCPLLVARRSLLIALVVAHCSSCSSLVAHRSFCSSLVAHRSLLIARCSSLVAHRSLLIARCSSLVAHRSLLTQSSCWLCAFVVALVDTPVVLRGEILPPKEPRFPYRRAFLTPPTDACLLRPHPQKRCFLKTRRNNHMEQRWVATPTRNKEEVLQLLRRGQSVPWLWWLPGARFF